MVQLLKGWGNMAQECNLRQYQHLKCVGLISQILLDAWRAASSLIHGSRVVMSVTLDVVVVVVNHVRPKLRSMVSVIR